MSEQATQTMIRDRVRELRRVPAGELRANPKNWRTHPDEQRKALSGVLEEVGFADAVLARELPDGSLELIDGHLRAEELPADYMVPVLVLDVTEAEADKVLATHDPLAAMAHFNTEKLDELLQGIDAETEALQAMLDATATQAGLLEAIAASEEEATKTANPYTTKVSVPPYEITGPKPALSQMYDDEKCQTLLAAIDASDLPDEEKHFLRAAAYRHVVFNFQEVANYYAHSEADVQQHFEDSALVIVDVDRAIQNGWTRLGQALDAIFSDEKENPHED